MSLIWLLWDLPPATVGGIGGQVPFVWVYVPGAVGATAYNAGSQSTTIFSPGAVQAEVDG